MSTSTTRCARAPATSCSKTHHPQLVAAVTAAAAGDALIAPAVTRRLLAESVRRPRPGADPALAGLTEREREILIRLGRGLSNGEIAAELYLGEVTVKTHVSNVLGKLGLRDRTQTVVYAYETGLVQPGAAQP